MLFNSYPFILVFLPCAFAGFFLSARISSRLAIVWLVGASLVFYGYWEPRHVPILIASIIFNFLAGLALLRWRSVALLWLAIGADLSLLAFYKYLDFFIGTINFIAGSHLPLTGIVLPLGISFFTFTQIAFLVDVQRQIASDRDFGRYALFVTYFPHLIAGPILHHQPTMSQFAAPQTFRPDAKNISLGLVLFAVGISKKVGIADNLAPYANLVFDAARDGGTLSFTAAWVGALSYTFQLYFDFSGYSDMALGLSLLFNVVIPINFFSPYKSFNIIEFWRRWHISLSTFLRDYLYIPLGGNRNGAFRRHLNLLITMVLGGLWHGAAWTFVLWGTLHGLYLLVNHAWRSLNGPRLGIFGWALTFLSVVVGWVFFRSESVGAALRMLGAMVDFGSAVHVAEDAILKTSSAGELAMMIGAAGIIAFLLPNSVQVTNSLRSALDQERWLFAGGLAAASGVLFGITLMMLNRITQFLYFQF